jgi:hypothetical protein
LLDISNGAEGINDQWYWTYRCFSDVGVGDHRCSVNRHRTSIKFELFLLKIYSLLFCFWRACAFFFRVKKKERKKKKRKYSCDNNSDKHTIKKKKWTTAKTGLLHHQNTLHIIDLSIDHASKKRHKYTHEKHRHTHIHRQRKRKIWVCAYSCCCVFF